MEQIPAPCEIFILTGIYNIVRIQQRKFYMILDKDTFERTGEIFETARKRTKIVCQCDYCGGVFDRAKHNIERSRKHSKIDACTNCTQKKRIDTNNIIFGTDNAFQNKDIKEKIKQKNMEIYGVPNPFQNKQVQEKQKATCRKKYNVDNPFQNEEIKKKIYKTLQEKYGVSNNFQRPEIRDKQQDTLVRRYGVKHALQNAIFRQKAMDTCIANFGIFPANNYGKTQEDIKNWLNSFGFNFKSNRSLIPGKEIDLYDANKNIAIEYSGLHWHHENSPEPRDKNYHHFKFQECLKQNIQLLTIFSDEWEIREKQCKSHIKSLLGINDVKIFGRQCKVEQIIKEQGRLFFNEYHIQGTNKLGIVFFGLFYKDELMGVMSLGRHNRQCKNIVLDRLCFKDGVQVLGGASKLFSRCVDWAIKNGFTKIISFSDNRWSIGKVYKAMNFKVDKEYGPDYSYVDIKSPRKRISKQSQKKSSNGCPEGMTELQWTLQNGLSRIWDCGKIRWVYDIIT